MTLPEIESAIRASFGELAQDVRRDDPYFIVTHIRGEGLSSIAVGVGMDDADELVSSRIENAKQTMTNGLEWFFAHELA